MRERLGNLLTIKSLVTLGATAIFAVLSVGGKLSAQEFLTVYTVIVSFYFGTQFEKSGGNMT